MLSLQACSGTPQYSNEAREALESLRKLQAATQVGVSYQQYRQLLIDAKAKTNAASSALPDGTLKTALNKAVDAFVDAGNVWGAKVGGDNRLHKGWGPGKTLISKYSLPVENFYSTPEYRRPQIDPESINADTALQLIWQHSNAHVEDVAKILEPKA
jgi:hypothetical protein